MYRNVEFIPDARIERRAIQMLINFQNRFGVIDAPPVPIDRIAEKHLDLRFDWDEIDDLPEGRVLGYIDPATKRICMNTRWRSQFDEFIGPEAFTKAHEVGHWDLHVFQGGEKQLALPFVSAPEPQRYMCTQSSTNPREYQANRYAAYLLMPYSLLAPFIAGLDLTDWSIVKRLAERFGVSGTAMRIRLESMKLIYTAPDGRFFRSEQEYRMHMAGRN